MRYFVLLVLGLALAAPALTEEGERSVSLPNATVLASPGCPEGLHAFLPGRRAPGELAWPLPDGPLLVLGLPDEDPLAFELATMWGILPPDGDLHGGYVRVAWHDGRRPIAAILGADAAALYAARFELRTLPPKGPASPDFTEPPPEGVVHVEGPWHHSRPRYRVRAVLPTRSPPEDLLETMIAGRANRVWIHESGDVDRTVRELLPKLRRYGVEPVLLLSPEHPSALAERLAPWRTEGGIRRFLVWAWAAPLTQMAVKTLRATGPVDEIVLFDPVPVAGTSRVAELSEARAACRVRTRPPTYFLEDWASVSRTPVPSRPRGRPPAFGRRLAGIVVFEGPGLEVVLRDAWDGPTDEPDAWEAQLLPVLPGGVTDARAFLRETRTRLTAAAEATYGAVPWMAPLAAQITRDLAYVPDDAVLVPRVPAPITPDGVLDEPAWRWAARFDVTRADGTRLAMLTVADGKRLAVAFRAPTRLEEARFQIGPPRSDAGGFSRAFGGRVGEKGSKHGVYCRTAAGVTWEGVLDHVDLGGDAHPARVFGLRTWTGDRRNGELSTEQLATLVLGP